MTAKSTVEKYSGAGQSRACGTCTLCCRLLGVHELKKEPLVECEHCTPGVGCKIYWKRPNECAGFDCAWLLGKMPEELKPSETFVVLSDLADDIKKQGLEFTEGKKVVVVYTDPEHPNAYKTGKMKNFLNLLLSKGTELILVDNGKKVYMKWGTVELGVK